MISLLHRETIDGKTITLYAKLLPSNKNKTEVTIIVQKQEEHKFIINTEDIERSNEAVSWLTNKGYGQVWINFIAEKTDSIATILDAVEEVIEFNHQYKLDIYLFNNVFRIDKDSFLSPKEFIFWYIATLHRIPRVSESEWREFITEILNMSKIKQTDPLSVDLLEIFTDMLQSSEIHTSFCDVVAQYKISGGGKNWFVYRKSENFSLYVPSSITQSLKRRAEIGSKAFRSYFSPFLYKDNVNRPLGTSAVHYTVKPQSKFWVLNMEKLALEDSTIANALVNLIDCEKSCTVKEDVK